MHPTLDERRLTDVGGVRHSSVVKRDRVGTVGIERAAGRRGTVHGAETRLRR